MKYSSESIGRTIAVLRENREMSQEVLSGLAGIARSHLSVIENGKKSPSISTLSRISEAFGLLLSDLFRIMESCWADTGSAS